ncbi:MAG: hypothetical protein ACRDH2_20525 [Anaerolineales bacterium]
MWLDRLSSFISRYKGLPIMIAVALVALNFLLQVVHLGWLSSSNLFLHLGIIIGLIGVLLAEALG